VVRWIKNNGLIADRTQVPLLIWGSDLKDFLGIRRAEVRTRLALHHFYCLGCRGPQEPDGKFAEYTQQTPTTGMLKALCPACGCILNKVVMRADLAAIRAKKEDIVQQANSRLVSLLLLHSHYTPTWEARTDGKTQLG
jgi:hypothetical protein